MQKRKKEFRYFLILHVILLIYSVNAIFSKLASRNQFLSSEFFFFYGLVLINLFIYAILWQQILKKIPLTSAFSNKSIIIIWGMIWGSLFFNEKISLQMILGGLIIILGVYLVVTDNVE